MWIFVLISLAFITLLVRQLNKNFNILAMCPRVKTADGSNLNSKLCIIAGNTVFGNNFDIISKNPGRLNCEETIFQYCRRNTAYSNGRSYLLQFLFSSIYNITNVEDAEEVLQSQILITKGVIYDLIQPLLGNGLLTSTDQKWHFRRKTLTSAFHFNILQSFIEVFKEESIKLSKRLQTRNDDVLSLIDVIPEFTLNTVCETALGVKLDIIAGGSEYRKTIHAIEKSIVKRLCNPLMYYRSIYYMFGDYRELHKNIRIAHDFSSKIIKKKREEYQNRIKAGQQEKVDKFRKKKRYAMLDTLLDAEQKAEINHAGICDEVNTFMFEGYDTTSTCLIFTLMNLALNQDVQEKCHKEVEQLDDLSTLTIFDFNKLEYLECVIKETLRLYPSVPFISRQCVENTQLNGLIFPKHTQIHVHIFDIMRDARHFPKPLKFQPDRFLPLNTVIRHPFAFMPFSAGPRNCIGQKFAVLEMKVILVSIIKNFLLLPVTRYENIIFENGLVLRSQQNVQIKLTNRR